MISACHFWSREDVGFSKLSQFLVNLRKHIVHSTGAIDLLLLPVILIKARLLIWKGLFL